MKKFAMKAVERSAARPARMEFVLLTPRPFLQPIKLEDFEDIVSSEEAFFLYLQNFDTSVDDLVS